MARSRWQKLVKHLASRWSFTPKHERRQGRDRQLTWPDICLTTRSEKALNSEQSVELLIIPQSCATSQVTEGGSLAVQPPGLREIVLQLLPKTSSEVYAGIVIGVKSRGRLRFYESNGTKNALRREPQGESKSIPEQRSHPARPVHRKSSRTHRPQTKSQAKKRAVIPQTPFSWVIERRHLEESRPDARPIQSGWT